jgi:two-component sensor histidine kinase
MLKKIDEEIIELTISDNGVGIADGYDYMNKNTLGMQLFRSIAEDQLMGEINITNQNGLAYKIQFKNIIKDESKKV